MVTGAWQPILVTIVTNTGCHSNHSFTVTMATVFYILLTAAVFVKVSGPSNGFSTEEKLFLLNAEALYIFIIIIIIIMVIVGRRHGFSVAGLRFYHQFVVG